MTGKNERTSLIVIVPIITKGGYYVFISQLKTFFDESRVQRQPAVHRDLTVIGREKIATVRQDIFGQSNRRVYHLTLFCIEYIHVMLDLPEAVGIIPNASRYHVKNIDLFVHALLIGLEPTLAIRVIHPVIRGIRRNFPAGDK